MKMQRCKKCYMPDTRPGSVFEGGVCQACRNYAARDKVDWTQREEELRKLCDKYRRDDGYYDCLIPVSGGKDSHFLVYTIKEKMGMNPLLVTVADPFTKSKAGEHNFRNLGKTFNCDHILFNISEDVFRRATRFAFEKFLDPLRFVEAAIYTIPYKTAINYNIPLIIFGENSRYEYGELKEDDPSANEYVENMFKSIDLDIWRNNGFLEQELNPIVPPKDGHADVIFMSYFYPWSSVSHLEIAQKRGFRDLTHEWKREGYFEDFEQIDSVAYIVHIWLKYPKFGFQRICDLASRRVREGYMELEHAKKLIDDNDHKLDQKALDDFLAFTGYSVKEFWEIVDKFAVKYD